jgi:hypothetical protein
MQALSAQGAVDALNDGNVEPLFLPFALDAPILHFLLKNPRFRPMNFTEAEALSRIFPFLVRLVLPRAVLDFAGIIPATELILIASPNVVLVRKDDTRICFLSWNTTLLSRVRNSPRVSSRCGAE